MGKLTKAQSKLSRSNPDVARLISKITFDQSGCWNWGGTRNDKGYGVLYFRGKNWRAHRVSYTLFCGEIPAGLMVCHHCDNPQCVNPHHLFLGHAKTNMQDMSRKGRGRNFISSDQSHFGSGHPPRGEDGGGAKLTETEAKEIILLASSGVLTSELAQRFGLDRTAVQRILRGNTWKHLERPSNIPRPTGRYSRTNGRSALPPENGGENHG